MSVATVTCPRCDGAGTLPWWESEGLPLSDEDFRCPICGGRGRVGWYEPRGEELTDA